MSLVNPVVQKWIDEARQAWGQMKAEIAARAFE